jgi:hypothetical protein
MKFAAPMVASILFFTLTPAGRTAPDTTAPVAFTLSNGASAVVIDSSLRLRNKSGKYAIAPAGRYHLKDGRPLVVGSQGHLDASSIALAKTIVAQQNSSTTAQQTNRNVSSKATNPAPAKTPHERVPFRNLGGRVQVGSHF